MAKAKAKAAAAKSAAPASNDYEGKQHYPKALYGKNAKGEVVQRRVESASDHYALEKEAPGMGWTEDLASHGVETHPAASVVADEKLATQPKK